MGHERARSWALIAVSLGLCAALLTIGGDVPSWLYGIYILIDVGILITLGWSRRATR